MITDYYLSGHGLSIMVEPKQCMNRGRKMLEADTFAAAVTVQHTTTPAYYTDPT
jgi:hypothetical protein